MICGYCRLPVSLEEEVLLGDVAFHEKCADNWVDGFSSSFHAAKEIGMSPPEGADVWWHAREKTYANFDPWSDGDYTGSHMVIELIPYIVTKYTPKGVRLSGPFGNNFFVLGSAIRQHAVPTKELALLDLVHRKEKHIRMLEYRIEDAKSALEKTQHAINHERHKPWSSTEQTS